MSRPQVLRLAAIAPLRRQEMTVVCCWCDCERAALLSARGGDSIRFGMCGECVASRLRVIGASRAESARNPVRSAR